MAGIADYNGPSWARGQGRKQPPAGSNGGLPKGFRKLVVISDLPAGGTIAFQPRYLNGQILVGVQGEKCGAILASFSPSGDKLWAVYRTATSEEVKALLEVRDGILIYTHHDKGKKGWARIIDWQGNEVASNSSLSKDLRFQHDPEDGSVYFIYPKGGIKKWLAGELENARDFLSFSVPTLAIFRLHKNRLYFQIQGDAGSSLYAWDKVLKKNAWGRAFGDRSGSQFTDLVVGDAVAPEQHDFASKLFLSTKSGMIYALEAETGQQSWSTGPLTHVQEPLALQAIHSSSPGEDLHNLLATNPGKGAISAISLYSYKERSSPFPLGISGAAGFSRPVPLQGTFWLAANSARGETCVFMDGIGRQVATLKTNASPLFAPVDLGQHQFAVATAPNELTVFGFDY